MLQGFKGFNGLWGLRWSNRHDPRMPPVQAGPDDRPAPYRSSLELQRPGLEASVYHVHYTAEQCCRQQAILAYRLCGQVTP